MRSKTTERRRDERGMKRTTSDKIEQAVELDRSSVLNGRVGSGKGSARGPGVLEGVVDVEVAVVDSVVLATHNVEVVAWIGDEYEYEDTEEDEEKEKDEDGVRMPMRMWVRTTYDKHGVPIATPEMSRRTAGMGGGRLACQQPIEREGE